MVFKKYFPDDADTTTFTEDVDKLERKYGPELREYCFMRALLKVYFDELRELKELKRNDNS